MQFSYSRVDTYEKCPYKFKLRYVDKIEITPTYNADNPLVIGTAMHTGIEQDVKNAVKEYFNNFPVINDGHINEVIKLEHLIPRVETLLPKGKFEFQISTKHFKGYIDLLVDNGDGTFDIYEFKYSNNIKHYLQSRQMHIYKYFLEKEYNLKVRNLNYVFIPKTTIRQKKDENITMFRRRIIETLKDAEIKIIKINYVEEKIKEFFNLIEEIRTAKDFPKNEGRLCRWCEYENLCKKGDDFMKIKKNDNNTKKNYIKTWIYGMPFVGKSTFADTFPSPLFINTDGNYRTLQSPYIDLKDTEQQPWLLFKEIINELKNEEGRFQTIVIDLLEDVYEFCRQHMYEELGITHEADDGFAAWDKVRWEFLTTLRKLLDLNFNIILISHEDRSREITMKSGEKLTQIKPNITDKVALKIAGMVDVVGRVVADGGVRELSFNPKEEVFGGGRLKLRSQKILLEYSYFMRNLLLENKTQNKVRNKIKK